MQQSGDENMATSARNLILCLDGTSNKFCEMNTNVVKLFGLLRADKSQLLYYDSGIGAASSLFEMRRGSVGEKIEQGVDMAFAIDFPQHVTSAYQWLSDYYDEGDHVYLFGFSRGAYTARVLAGMVENVGLLPKGNHSQVPLAWQMFRDMQDGGQSPEIAEAFKKTFSRSTEAKIEFIGVWDTVASLGGVAAEKLPFASRGSVKVFRQALALDERRVKFQPEYYEFDHTETENGNPTLKNGDLKYAEVWFAGCHSDVGGGDTLDDQPSIANIPLRWMVHQAAVHGVRFDDAILTKDPVYRDFVEDRRAKSCGPSEATANQVIEYAATQDTKIGADDRISTDANQPAHNSLSWKWYPAELLNDGKSWLPHLGKGRQIQPWQLIHGSVFNKIAAGDHIADPTNGTKTGYTPAATFRGAQSYWGRRQIDAIAPEAFVKPVGGYKWK